MTTEWKEVRLGDVLYSKNQGVNTTTEKVEYCSTGYPVIRAKNIKEYGIDFKGLAYINKDTFKRIRKECKPQNGDLLYTNIGSQLGNAAVVDVDLEFIIAWNVLKMQPNINFISVNFLSYLLNSKFYRTMIKSLNSSSTMPFISGKAIETIKLKLPPLPEQKAIAEVLGALDDKIELNNKMNKTLEETAQALFKSWFVDFDPVHAKAYLKDKNYKPSAKNPMTKERAKKILAMLSDDVAPLFPDSFQPSELGDIPKGWGVSIIGDEVEVVGGGTPSTKNDVFWSGGEYHWTTPKDLSGLADKVLMHTERKITEEGLSKISSGLLPIDTVLMSSRAPVGYLVLAKVPTAINQGFIAMKCNKKLTPEYILQWANSVMDEIKQRASGSTFAEISKKNFRQINLLVPPSGIVQNYTSIVEVTYNKITESVAESAKLVETRDYLLPKLMSGEVRLSI